MKENKWHSQFYGSLSKGFVTIAVPADSVSVKVLSAVWKTSMSNYEIPDGTHTHTHARTHARTLTHTHTDTHTHTHRHTH